jgi:hypothetical protein
MNVTLLFWVITPRGSVRRYQCFFKTLVTTFKYTLHYNSEQQCQKLIHFSCCLLCLDRMEKELNFILLML